MFKSRMSGKLRGIKNDESGVMIVLVALLMPIFLGFAGLAIDVGHIMVVKGELQNAADAAALSGAGRLWYNSTSSTPDWFSAETAASTSAPPNQSGGALLVDYEVQSGYWNLDHSPPGLRSNSITPGARDAPAIKVIVRKASGKNGGPVNTFFGPFIGKSTVDVAAEATAVSNVPSSVNPGTLLPIAISREVADQKNSHRTPATAVRIGSSYHYPNSMAGQWTSFTTDNNDVTTVRDLIANGNPDPIGMGTPIWIEPGTKTALYSDIRVGSDVVFPVVDVTISDTTHSAVPVYGFIGFHITASVGGSGKYIEGYFLDSIKIGGSPGGGPAYGVYVPPRLVQ